MRYFLLICSAFVMACHNGNSEAVSDDSTNTETSVSISTDTAASIITPACYTHETSNNLVSLKLNTVQPTVSGHLEYAIMGKDKNEGNISGTMRGDTLFADYNFMSEGKRSVRQVAFLRRGDSFVEGYADQEQQGDRMVFSNSDTLSFNGTMVLKLVPCK